MLRIHFGAADLSRVRIAAAPDVTWEIVLSLLKLQEPGYYTAFDSWRRAVAGSIGPWLHTLVPLVPRCDYFPDFLTPQEGTLGLDAAVDAILHTPARRLRGEIELLAHHRRLPAWAHDVAAGRPSRLQLIAQTVRRYHDAVLTPLWPRIDQALAQDRSRRVRALAGEGCDGLLGSFAPLMRWSPPTLEVRYSLDRDLHLAGRGLLLVPMFFCWDTPVSLVDPELQPVLVYPVERDLDFDSALVPDRTGALCALLGTTRAAVLRSLERPCTTTELAHRAGICLASASQHAAVLRDAGLITTSREGRGVRHARTTLGHQLVGSGAV